MDDEMKSDVVKFRSTPSEKQHLISAADEAKMSLSAFVRRASLAAVNSRMLSRPMLADSHHMRTLANDLAALANDDNADRQALATMAASIAGEIHAITSRHLDRVRS